MRNVVDVGGSGKGEKAGMGNGDIGDGTIRDLRDLREEARREGLLEGNGNRREGDGLRWRGSGSEQRDRGWNRQVDDSSSGLSQRDDEGGWGLPGPMPGSLVS